VEEGKLRHSNQPVLAMAAAAVAGGAARLCVVKGVYDTSYRWVSYDDDPDGTEACRRTRLQASLLSGAGAVMTAKAL
jgi:hypothetical protein